MADADRFRLEARALMLWPRLNRRAVTRCHGDLVCISRLVERRTSLPRRTIHAMLQGHRELDVEIWFG